MKSFVYIQKGSPYSVTCYPLKSIEIRYLTKSQAPRKHGAIKSLCFMFLSGYVGHPNLAAWSALYVPLNPNRRSGGSSSVLGASGFVSHFQMSVQFSCHMA